MIIALYSPITVKLINQIVTRLLKYILTDIQYQF